jgi:phytoene dehydrogenase-like protein
MRLSRQASLCAVFALLISTQSVAASKYNITVRGGDEASFTPTLTGDVVDDKESYDVIVVGGGLAGMTAALYLSDNGKKVLIMEKEDALGGLAFGGNLSYKIRFDRGAAYWTDAYDEEQAILERIHLGDFRKKYAISEPADSYFWNGKLYLGIWEEKTMEQLPASFAVFKAELQNAGRENLIPNQPLEDDPNVGVLDAKSAAEWVREMPDAFKARVEKGPRTSGLKGKQLKDALDRHAYEVSLLQRFKDDTKVDRKDPMGDVLGLLELYCRSALGSTPDKVSAVAFANFYISEIETRYTTPVGTGGAAERLEKMLRDRPKQVSIRLRAGVTTIDPDKNDVTVTYVKNGHAYRAHAKYAVHAAQLKLAPKIIRGFAEREPEQAKIFTDLDYAHYSVHAVIVKGHPYRATYDTWTHAADYTDDDFTDVILGRWMDPTINGYKGMRTFKKNPGDEAGIFTIYHPLPPKWIGSGYTQDQAESIAEHAVDRLLELYSPLLSTRWHTKIKVRAVETNRWPFSVHVAAPGHFSKRVKIMRKPFGRVFFANNNLGTPAFEEALFRGHCAAVNILVRMAKDEPSMKYTPETWTKCPVE